MTKNGNEWICEEGKDFFTIDAKEAARQTRGWYEYLTLACFVIITISWFMIACAWMLI